MLLINAAISAVIQLAIFAVLPVLGYWIYHRIRHGATFGKTLKQAGLQVGDPRYALYGLGFALLTSAILLLFVKNLEPFTRRGSAQHQFVGLGLTATSVTLALLVGAVQTAFAEEVLFRGLIAGSLGRWLPLVWANVVQALIFLAPHLAILRVAPELWGILPMVFVGGLLFGWLRIKSGSILGSWSIHAMANVTVALMVAARTGR